MKTDKLNNSIDKLIKKRGAIVLKHDKRLELFERIKRRLEAYNRSRYFSKVSVIDNLLESMSNVVSKRISKKREELNELEAILLKIEESRIDV